MKFLEKLFGKKNDKININLYYILILFNVFVILFYLYIIIFLIFPLPYTIAEKIGVILPLIFSYSIINLVFRTIYKNISEFNLKNKEIIIIGIITILIAIFNKSLSALIVVPLFYLMVKFNKYMFDKTYRKDKNKKNQIDKK